MGIGNRQTEIQVWRWEKDLSWRYKSRLSTYGCKAWDKMRPPSEKKSKAYRNSETLIFKGTAEEGKSRKETGQALSKDPKENLKDGAITKAYGTE